MGESKRRKEAEPSYGKYSTKMRGLILSPPVEVHGNSIHLKRGDLDEQDIRSSLLYWDRITIPTSNIIYIPGGATADYLASCGILQRKHYNFHGEGGPSLITAQANALIDLEKESPGMWSLGSGENSILVKQGFAQQDNGLIMTLINALPVPKNDTPLSDILEFKQKRRDELLVLRAHIEGLSAEIASANESQDELNKKIAELDIACSNLIKTTKEFQLPVYLANMTASLNFEATKFIGTFIAVWGSTAKLGFGATAATIASITSAAATTISIKADIKFQHIKRTSSPFKYAYYVQRDLG